MALSVLAELDELVLAVRDRSAQVYVEEAVRAYRNRLYRPAIVSTWTALVYDIIGKIRELAAHSDRAATAFVGNLDAAITARNTVRLQQIENEILNTARSDFEFIGDREKVELDRLQEDRHLCAHPAFTGESVLFTPSPEQVRVHIVHAVEHVLKVVPVQGRAALARLHADILRPSFPQDQEQVNIFLEHRYLSRAKDSLIGQFISALLSVLLRGSEVDLLAKPDAVAMCLIAVATSSPEAYERRMRDQLPRRTDGMDDAYLLNLLLLAHHDARCWNWIDRATRIRLETLIRTAPLPADAWGLVGYALGIGELREVTIARIQSLSREEQDAIIARNPRIEFVDQAIAIYRSAGSFRYAEYVGRRMILPMANEMSAEHVRKVLAAAQFNGQVWDAADTPQIPLAVLHAYGVPSWGDHRRMANTLDICRRTRSSVPRTGGAYDSARNVACACGPMQPNDNGKSPWPLDRTLRAERRPRFHSWLDPSTLESRTALPTRQQRFEKAMVHPEMAAPVSVTGAPSNILKADINR